MTYILVEKVLRVDSDRNCHKILKWFDCSFFILEQQNYSRQILPLHKDTRVYFSKGVIFFLLSVFWHV